MRSERRSYWRLTALDQFDGQIWKSDGSYESADGRLPRSVDSSAATAVFQQTYQITSLDTIWLPAAYLPRSVDKASTEVRYEPDTSTLIVGTNVPNSNNASYTVQSALPLYDPQQLEQAPTDVPRRTSSTRNCSCRRTSARTSSPRRRTSWPARRRRTTRPSRCRTTSATTSRTTSRSRRPQHVGHREVPVRHEARLLRAVRRHVRGDGARSASPRAWPSASRPATKTRSNPGCTT